MSAVPIEYYTYKDYKHWEGDWELIGGIAYAMAPAPFKKHQHISTAISAQLYFQLEECNKCEVLIEEDYKISEDTILRPDIAVVCNDPNPRYISKAPDIVVEVISPATARRDETLKFSIYEKEGVKYYILIYPDELKAKVYKNEGEFKKVGDYFVEVVEFETECSTVKIDFNRVFKRFR